MSDEFEPHPYEANRVPSKSPAQARLMAAAAHTPGGFGNVPQKVGREFNQADKGSGIRKKGKRGKGKAKMGKNPFSGIDKRDTSEGSMG